MITAFLFWGRVVSRGPGMDWFEFYVARLYRLYPAYLLMVGLLSSAVIFAGEHWQSIGDIFFQRSLRDWLLFTMFHTQDLNGFPNTSMLVANVTWSLRYEWLFYIALPLLAFLFSRARSIAAMVGSALALLFLYWRFGWTMPFGNGALHTFFGGVVGVYWVRNARLTNWSRSRFGTVAALVAVAVVMTCSPLPYWVPATIALTFFFAIVASGNDLWGVLRWPGLLWLGHITYSIYLLHGLLLWLVFQQLLPHALAVRAGVFVPAAAAVAIILVLACSASFIAIERPGILLGRRQYRLISRLMAPAPGSQGSGSARPVVTSRPATTPDPVP
jgi:peptidoglycan/LPS O-acetylase OafA/YrhL